jgi:hypothetical protein
MINLKTQDYLKSMNNKSILICIESEIEKGKNKQEIRVMNS